MEYTLTNCLISKITTGGSEEVFPAETLKINFGKIEWCYTQQSRAGGGSVGNIASGWSLEKNCKL
jgi:type VI protein secretion system component Hcp